MENKKVYDEQVIDKSNKIYKIGYITFSILFIFDFFLKVGFLGYEINLISVNGTVFNRIRVLIFLVMYVILFIIFFYFNLFYHAHKGILLGALDLKNNKISFKKCLLIITLVSSALSVSFWLSETLFSIGYNDLGARGVPLVSFEIYALVILIPSFILLFCLLSLGYLIAFLIIKIRRSLKKVNKDFCDKEVTSQSNKIYKICYIILNIFILVNLIYKLWISPFILNDYYEERLDCLWIFVGTDAILLVAMFYFNLFYHAHKGMLLGSLNLSSDKFPVKKYLLKSILISLVISIGLGVGISIIGSVSSIEEPVRIAWGIFGIYAAVTLIPSFILLFVILFLSYFIAFLVVKKRNSLKKIDNDICDEQVTSQSNKIYKICYVTFSILVILDFLLKLGVLVYVWEINDKYFIIIFGADVILFILLFYFNLFYHAHKGIVLGALDLKNNKISFKKCLLITTLVSSALSVSFWITASLSSICYNDLGARGAPLVCFEIYSLLILVPSFILLFCLLFLSYLIVFLVVKIKNRE